MDFLVIGAMDAGLWLQYIAIFFVLVAMEGLLSADNALVLAVMVRPLAPNLRSKALFYGLLGAIVLRFTALFFVSFLANVWQAQAAGAAYLIYVGLHNLYEYKQAQKDPQKSREDLPAGEPKQYLHSRKEFWWTVAKIEFTDIAFAVDSILAAVAIAISMPPTGWGHIGGMDAGEFILVLSGGLCGVVLMRFAATIFVKLLDKRPKLEVAAFLLVTWVGIKLVVVTLAHEAIAVLPAEFPESTLWHILFFGVMILIALWGWFSSTPAESDGAKK